MREFRLAKSWRIITYLFCIGFIVLAMYLLYKPLIAPFRFSHIFYFLGAAGLFFLTYYMYQDTRFGKFIIAEDCVTLIAPFGKRTIPLDAIKGYRKIESYLIILPVDRRFKKIKLSTYLASSWEIETWLGNNYPNVDEAEVMEEENEIIQNAEFGITEESRVLRLEEARRVAKYTNRMAWVLMLWLVLYPFPYTLTITLGIVFPIIAVGLCYYRGMMKGGDKEKSAYPTVTEGFILPGMALLLRSLFDYTILDYNPGWTMVIVLTTGLFILYQIPTGGFSPRKASDFIFLALFPIFTFAYSFGTITLMNCYADQSTPVNYKTLIVDKRISKGKTTTYYLELKPWGNLNKPEEVKVSHDEYEQVNVQDTVTVIQRNGYLLMPWIEVAL